ncbi:hypothetical protein CISIN_1g0349262mg, partial [Citrus sinensis]
YVHISAFLAWAVI